MPLRFPPYINIHSHYQTQDDDILTLVSRYEHFERQDKTQQYSLGIHPWYIRDAATQIEQLTAHIGDPQVLALGECGLDRLCTTDWRVQVKVFAQQIALANQYRKPLVIHCVKAFPETLSMLQDAEVPVVFHGFNNRASLAVQVLNQGHYLSFGGALLRENATAAAVLADTPDDRFLLETDDQPGLDIREIYRKASFIRKTGEDVIILQLQKNFQNVVHT